MDYDQFLEQLRSTMPVGTIIDNPGGGTSEVLSFNNNSVAYKRGKSVIYVPIRDLFNVFSNYSGHHVSASDLKLYLPSTFDSTSNGHSCNCTFLFLSLQRMGLAGEVQGKVVRGDPFSVLIRNP